MALSRLPFVNLSRAYYRLDSLLTRYTRSVYPRSNRTLTILLLYSPPSVETRSRDNGRLTIFPVLQIPRGPFRAGRRSKEWYLSMHSISLFSDGLTRSWPHQESTQNSSNGGYRFEHVAENSKRREPRGWKLPCILTRVRSFECLSSKRGEQGYVRVHVSVCLFDERKKG